MGRGKLTMELIEKEKARMITYQKRKRGLKKKAQEFTTLCGVPTCMIIYGPRLNNRPVDVEIWPQDHQDFMAVVNSYRDKAFSSIRGVKSQNMYTFFADRKRKVDEQIAKTRKANYESKFSGGLDDLNQFSMDQLQAILAMFDYNLDVATRKLTILKGNQILIDDSKSELLVSGCSISTAQFLFQKTMEVDVFNRQMPISSSVYMQPPYYPSDHHHHQAFQMAPFDFNPMMVMANGGDQMGNSPYIPRHLDPMAAMIDNTSLMMNNPRPALQFFGSTSSQPYMQFPVLPSISSQIHGSQLNDFYGDINNSEFRHKSQTSCKYEYGSLG